MTLLSDLFLTEKEKTLILLALDTHMYSMHQNGCAKAAVDIFVKLEERISNYSTKDAELIMFGLNQLAEEADEAVEDEDDPIWDTASFVAALTEDDAIDIYEQLVERLGEDPDDISLEDTQVEPLPSIKEQLQQSIELDAIVKGSNPNGPLTSTEKLGIKTDYRKPVDTPWYDRLPSDTEPSDLEDVINKHLRTVK